MALFGTTNAYLGLDIGTSALKVVELVNRRKRIELTTYGSANLANLLVGPKSDADSIKRMANVIVRLLDKAGVSTDSVVAALPSSVVFSTVLTLPQLSEADLDRAVRVAARDVVPADLDDTVLGWSRLGQSAGPHPAQSVDVKNTPAPPAGAGDGATISTSDTVSVFLTAAPKDVVERYIQVIEMTKLELVALEVETFALARSLLSNQRDSALVADIGNRVTTFHIIDGGTPRASVSVEYGGRDITQAIADSLRLSPAEAEKKKIAQGLSNSAPKELREVIMKSLLKILEPAQQLLARYAFQYHRQIPRTILIGGGASLPELARHWSSHTHLPVVIGTPWRGLALPNLLENRLAEIGPNFAVAAGLAERQLAQV